MPEPRATFNAKIIRSKNKNRGGFDVVKKAPGSPTTIDEDFNEDQYGNPYLKEPKEKRADNDNQKEASFLKNLALRDWLRSTDKSFDITADQPADLKANLRSGRAWVTSGIILGYCSVFFIAQIIFWLISILGLAVEFGAYTVGDFLGLGLVSETLGELASSVVPGLDIFTLGYILATASAMIQLGIAVAFYSSRGINPFKGTAMLWFMVIGAWYWLPIIGGFGPWGLYWMWKVITNN